MTNSYHIASELDKRCDKTHTHQKGTGNEYNQGTQHPQGIYRAICRGMIKERRNRKERNERRKQNKKLTQAEARRMVKRVKVQ